MYTSATTVIEEVGPAISGLPSWFTPGMALMARRTVAPRHGAEMKAASANPATELGK